MLKKLKPMNIICIILAITVLALGVLIGILCLVAPEAEDDGGGYYTGGLNFGAADFVLYKLSSNETLGSVYLKSQSYGNFDGQKWDESVPEYDKLINSKYSASYLTSMALENNTADDYLLTIQPATNTYVLPYYLSTNSYQGYENVQTSDIKNQGNANAAYSVYLHKYTSSDDVSHSEKIAKYELNYSKFVKENYLDIDTATLRFMNNIIKENNLSAQDPDIITTVTNYIRNIAKYDLLYDTNLDKEENTVISFMSGEYESGVCRHFASSATLLFRALGIPARYTVGYLSSVQADVVTSVTAINAHAWVEVYVDGIGWIYVDPTPPLSLFCPPDNPDPPIDSLGFFKVKSDKKTTMLLKTGSYGDYAGSQWAESVDFTGTMNGYSAQYMTGMSIIQSVSNATMNQVEITPLADLYALPYYVSSKGLDTHTIQTGDSSVVGDTSKSYTVNYYSLPEESVAGTSTIFNQFSKNYGRYVNSNYLYVEDYLRQYFDDLIAANRWNADDENIVEKVNEYLNDNYKLVNKVDEGLASSGDYVIDFMQSYKEGTALHFAASATLMYRALGIPARLCEGFKAKLNANSVATVTAKDIYYWVEVYQDGCGWIAIDVLDGDGLGDEKEQEIVDVFEIYSDTTDDHVYLKSQSYGDYNGSGFDVMTNVYTKTYNGLSEAYMTGAIIELGNLRAINISINSLTSEYEVPYILPYYMPSYLYGAEVQYDDVYITGPSNHSYNAIYYDYISLGSISSNPELEAYEREYRKFVYDNYLNIDEETFRYLYNYVILANNFDVNDRYIIEDVAIYMRNVAEYNLEYDKALDDQPNVVIAFLENYNEGICQHYAMAATMLYRALGIPARYTTGYVTETTAGKWTTVTNMKAHAWVEVYVDGFGWQRVEVTGGDYEELTVIELTFKGVEKQYDGKAWYPEIRYTGFEQYEKLGYRLDIAVNDARINPGKTAIDIDYYVVSDPSGKDVTEKFRIKRSDTSGVYHVYADEIYISSGDLIVTYDGTYHSIDISEFTVNGMYYSDYVFDNYYVNTMGQNHTLVITPMTSVKDACNVSSKYGVTIMNGNENVTSYYKIIRSGKVVVHKKDITISAASATVSYFDYLGDEFTYNEIIYNQFDLAEGDYIAEYQTIGTISEPGRVSNVLDPTSIKIFNAIGQDVTGNYNITTKNGELIMELPDA